MQRSPQIILIFFLALLVRWCITYHPYSGQGKPPMFGDYEAQRHWQEITFNLPIKQWYINSTDNDLQYWGLDYPPLTAYHSFLLGHVAHWINSSYVKLYESRGISSTDHKYFMRLTVLFADTLVYIPAMMWFTSKEQTLKSSQKLGENIFGLRKTDISLLTSLMYPGLILIDHGHFQYNCVSLGLFIAAVTAMLQNAIIFGSFLFVAALNYKQMELYHALPIFFYILGTYVPMKLKSSLYCLKMLACVSLTVVLTFFIVWLPFLKNWDVFASVIFRLFPIARGVFEDKVANVWCTINILYKLKAVFTNEQLAQICLFVTAVTVLPSCINLFLYPSKERFLISLINSALAFFLFSFQVHEKSILLVAIPVLLYLQKDPLPCFWFLLISHFSMLPLFIKDDLYIAYIATFVFYLLSGTWVWSEMFQYKNILNNKELEQYTNTISSQRKFKAKRNKSKLSIVTRMEKNLMSFWKNNLLVTAISYNQHFWIMITFCSSILGAVFLSIVSGFLKAPERYPDLFPLLISVYSCGHFIIFYLYFNYKQLCMVKNTTNKFKVK